MKINHTGFLGNVFLGKWLSGKRLSGNHLCGKVIMWEMSVNRALVLCIEAMLIKRSARVPLFWQCKPIRTLCFCICSTLVGFVFDLCISLHQHFVTVLHIAAWQRLSTWWVTYRHQWRKVVTADVKKEEAWCDLVWPVMNDARRPTVFFLQQLQ